MGQSSLEATFDAYWRILAPEGSPEPEHEQKLILNRRFRCDLVWRLGEGYPRGVVVELEGGTRMNGRHNRHDGFQKDAEKYNRLAHEGWIVLRYTSEQVNNDPQSVINEILATVHRWQSV